MSSPNPQILLRKIHNQFDPFRPLEVGDPRYVNCDAVRGDNNIEVELGREIAYANRVTHLLYTGHRGAGKSTELRRLAAYLKQAQFRVVLFEADQEDVNAQDTQYTDILLACTRHLLKDLQGSADNPVWRWVQSRLQALGDLFGGELLLENISLEAQLTQFAKITASLRANPDTRAQIRHLVDPHTESLVDALNQFIAEAMEKISNQSTQNLVLIVDNLDRIVPIIRGEGQRSNLEEIYIDRSEQLKRLNCHVVYTLPIALAYCSEVTDLRDIYDANPQVLPMIMVRSPDEKIYEPGLQQMKTLVAERIYETEGVDRAWDLESQIFESPETLNQLCLMSGGHVRNLMQLMQDAVKRCETLPISTQAAKRAVTLARETYRNSVEDTEWWQVLAQVYKNKDVQQDAVHRRLLFNRCVLEYCYADEEGEPRRWRDVNPLMRGIPEFQAALKRLP